jgi:hypothetical protein
MTYVAEEDRQEAFILDVLGEVVQDRIIEGPLQGFLEALSYDGYHGVYGDDDRALEALRVAVGTGNAEKAGNILIGYITEYMSGIAYDEIDDDLAAYGYEFNRGRR